MYSMHMLQKHRSLITIYADCDDAGFECDDGQCIKGEWECDNDPDCDDGSDEHAQCPGEL